MESLVESSELNASLQLPNAREHMLTRVSTNLARYTTPMHALSLPHYIIPYTACKHFRSVLSVSLAQETGAMR